MSKNIVHDIPILKYFQAKNANHHLSLQVIVVTSKITGSQITVRNIILITVKGLKYYNNSHNVTQKVSQCCGGNGPGGLAR